MTFTRFSQYLNQLEETASRNRMTEILAQLLGEASVAEVDKVCYLVLGRLGPLYEGIEFGISEKLMLKVLAQALEVEEALVRRKFKQLGDLGDVAKSLKNQRNTPDGCGKPVQGVFEELYQIAIDSGAGSQERKISALAELIQQADPLSAKYLVRIPLGKLRLGFSDVTLLDALSWMLKGDKSLRSEIERAYSVSADIGCIARLVKQGGLKTLQQMKVEVGTPIRPAMSERLASAEEIVEKLGEFAVEPKMDGFRVQIHIRRRQKAEDGAQFLKFVRIFSRNLENTTAMFPDIVKAVQQLPVESAVLDGEAIAYHPETGQFLPFQETVQRKRKYDIAEKARTVPLKVFLFDLLYLDGESLLNQPFKKRRQALAKILPPGQSHPALSSGLGVAEQMIAKDTARLRELFDLYISEGLEGVMCKKLDSPYQAGARNFNWVKYKRATEGAGLADTIDAVVMGYYTGRGQRQKFGLGAFLVGVRDEKQEQFVTLAKIGTGLTDEQWRQMYRRLSQLRIAQKPRQYEVAGELFPGEWVRPALVVEIKADEITRSPVHTAGRGDSQTGLALRFPRLVDFRDDKNPADATTIKEVIKLYQLQGR